MRKLLQKMSQNLMHVEPMYLALLLVHYNLEFVRLLFPKSPQNQP